MDLISLMFIILGQILVITYLEIVTSRIWHDLFHRTRLKTFLRGIIACRRCVDEYKESHWRENVIRKIERFI